MPDQSDSGPRNRATDLSATTLRVLNEPDAFTSGRVREILTPDFRRLDRRRIGAMPDADIDAFVESHLALAELAGGAVTFRMGEVVAVRGERLAVTRVHIVAGEAGDIEQIAVVRTDEPVERAELMILFDPDDVDPAIAELDRLQNDLAHG